MNDILDNLREFFPRMGWDWFPNCPDLSMLKSKTRTDHVWFCLEQTPDGEYRVSAHIDDGPESWRFSKGVWIERAEYLTAGEFEAAFDTVERRLFAARKGAT